MLHFPIAGSSEALGRWDDLKLLYTTTRFNKESSVPRIQALKCVKTLGLVVRMVLLLLSDSIRVT